MPSPSHSGLYYLQRIGWGVRGIYVLSCHQGMTRPQVGDGGAASMMEGSCEYIE
jgi:hypothetical protein